jgi:tritrans,polycis-undecaprenyl-diphosphate synthase [geranylgeranyl-diphosphate specific]|tara:strand:- start:700 stop:1467 length:768 start_codon:yes stop_codon:yes gene_type:complete
MRVPPFLYSIYEKFLRRQLASTIVPKHIGLIVDGNRRFALAAGLASRKAGHMAGSDKLEDFLRWCLELDVEIVTLYGFSTENFKRSSEEVEELMSIILNKFRTLQIDPLIEDENVKIKVIGRRDGFSQEMQDEIIKVEGMTQDHNSFQLNVAIGYGGRAEIVDAVKKIGEQIKTGEIEIDSIDEDMLSNHLYTEGMPDPDLIIRTSGEERLSGFLLWQSAYSELYFTQVFWPAFRKIDFWRAIRVWQQRNRRFGK